MAVNKKLRSVIIWVKRINIRMMQLTIKKFTTAINIGQNHLTTVNIKLEVLYTYPQSNIYNNINIYIKRNSGSPLLT